jgi:feruloyl-CoA synthase
MHEVGAMVFPNVLACRDLAGLPPDAPVEQVLASPGVHARFQGMLDKLSESSTGSANRISRLCLLSEPPTIDRGEITDKGSINQRAVLTHRAAIVEALHADTLPGMLKPAH